MRVASRCRTFIGLWILICPGFVSLAAANEAVPPDEGGFIESMGQPPRVFPYAGLSAGVHRPAGDPTDPTGTLTLGLFGNLLSPVASVGLAAEGYVGARGTRVDGGVRGLVSFRPLRFGVGVDYNIRDNDADLLISLLHPLRRGGPFGLGGRLRLDYLPTRCGGVARSAWGVGSASTTSPPATTASSWVS